MFGSQTEPWLLWVVRVTLLALGCAFLTRREKRGRDWERAVPAVVRRRWRDLRYTQVGLGGTT